MNFSDFVFSYRITRSISTNFAQSTLGPRDFKWVRKKDHVLFQGSWRGNNEKYYSMTFRGRVGHKCVGERSKSYVVVYREFVFKIFFSDNQLNLKCMWKHFHVVLILVVKIMTPEARIGQQRRIEIIHICKVSAFVAQVSDVNPEPPFSRFFEIKKNAKSF